MTAFDPQLAARIAESGIPLSADCARLGEDRLAEIRKFRDQCHPVTGALAVARVHDALNDLLAEVERLRGQTDPLIVRRVDMVVEPTRFEGETETLVACIAEDGRPVALLLDDEIRARLARNLRMDGGES